jgi:hypothetical protein
MYIEGGGYMYLGHVGWGVPLEEFLPVPITGIQVGFSGVMVRCQTHDLKVVSSNLTRNSNCFRVSLCKMLNPICFS